MVNFETNPEPIKEAFNSGIIIPKDYNAWLGAAGYIKELKKSFDGNEITATELKNETEKANGLYWERDDQTKGVFRFVLRGSFEPLDLNERKILKAKQSQPLQRQQPQRVKVDPNVRKIVEMADNILKSTRETQALLNKTAAKPFVKSNEQKPITQQQSNRRHAPTPVSLDEAISVANALLNSEVKRKGGK